MVRSPVAQIFAVASLAALGAGCSKFAVDPSGDPPLTLLVANTTCKAGQCTPLWIVAWPNIHAPSIPGGWWISLGTATAPSTCKTFPPPGSFVTVDASGARTRYPWTPSDTFTLTAQSLVDTGIGTLPTTTSTFVPGDAPGWSVTFDTFPASPIEPVPVTNACTP